MLKLYIETFFNDILPMDMDERQSSNNSPFQSFANRLLLDQANRHQARLSNGAHLSKSKLESPPLSLFGEMQSPSLSSNTPPSSDDLMFGECLGGSSSSVPNSDSVNSMFGGSTGGSIGVIGGEIKAQGTHANLD